MIEPNNPVLSKMLDRLFAAMVNGPSMNCRPHNSRQRVDLFNLTRLKDVEPGKALVEMLGGGRTAKLSARVPAPAKPVLPRATNGNGHAEELSPEERAARQAWLDQQSLLTKLRVIADDARTYEQDTGVYALNVGIPLLSLPPNSFGGRSGTATRRVLAPIAFAPVLLTVKTGAKQTVEIACRAEGADRVVPNIALFAWLEQQTGQPLIDVLAHETELDPWREIAGLVKLVSQRVDVKVPPVFLEQELPAGLVLEPTPKAEEDEKGSAIVTGAVIGLFPTSNQGLLKDTREMLSAGAPDGPLESFVRLDASLEITPHEQPEATPPVPAPPESVEQDRLVAPSDPCQTRAVRLARQCRGLVIHGPPGTGKSQTIANIIGDHLARGQRVLFVCDKRTALDVVADRLNGIGIGDLCATVYDPQRDQRELYRAVREQLDALAEAPLQEGAAARLDKIDQELSRLHEELTDYYRHLMGDRGGPGSFHDLVGQWLKESGGAAAEFDEAAVQTVPAAEFDQHAVRLRETLERGEAVDWAHNPWRAAAGLALADFLATPMDQLRRRMAGCVEAGRAVDATADPLRPPFGPEVDLLVEARRREQLADELKRLAALPVESARHWAKQTQAAVRAAAAEMDAASQWVEIIKAGPLDPTWKTQVTSTEQLAGEQKVLLEYADAFDARARQFAAVSAAAPDAGEAAVLKWMAADPQVAQAARKRLEAAAPLAGAVESSSLDPSLLARFQSAPLEAGKRFEALASLNAYLDVASTWHAAFHLGRKKAAEPVVRHFGLSLSPASAAQVKTFLTDVQKREDLRAAVEAAAGESIDATADDGDLLKAFRRHRDVLAALDKKQDGGPGAVPAAAINQLVRAQATAAEPILIREGAVVDGTNARRLADHLHRLEARLRVADLLRKVGPGFAIPAQAPDDVLLLQFDLHRRLLAILERDVPGTPVGGAIVQALTVPEERDAVISALSSSVARATAVIETEKTVYDSGLFDRDYLKGFRTSLRRGDLAIPTLSALAELIDTLEGVLRVREGLSRLPAALSAAASRLLEVSSPAGGGFSAIRRAVMAGEITRYLQQHPQLQSVDGQRLKTAFDRFRKLQETRKEAVRDLIRFQWLSKQKQRLLSGTGSRLNSLGADLRRRLTSRGERAMRLRQVVAHGAAVEGGDPLFDLRPVWMASPETVAQLFPRQPIFDVVVFDEASQCRLEEALPVLTRAGRVVIAGDPKQLPPTRFFESAVVSSDQDDAETDQELFEAHQGEVEDLLTAALGLDIHQSYLDVHYRSRNADLIGFSNEHFYSSRLQAIPAHPRHVSPQAPLVLHRADGTYEKRRNVAEAQAVCELVRDLLSRPTPPSIGIACFNLVQRDLIVDSLDELAEEDPEFRARLAEARERRRNGSSDALFVKNLENVQGDERDDIIISTTYGPDSGGKFRRNFGPLGTAGGGRRLNVLVTRAREMVHVVTSIPHSAYASLPPVPTGATPGGGWLLFAYLAFIEQLQEEYETNRRILQSAGPVERAAVGARPSRSPSALAQSLSARLATDHNLGSEVHWGNDGFCIDVAMHHPVRADDAALGVLCDMSRYRGSDDPVAWDVFRTAMHEQQGWKLHRLWSPHFFRDPAGTMDQIAETVRRAGQQKGEATAAAK